MSESRDQPEATRAGPTPAYWNDWFERLGASAGASPEQWQELGRGWHLAVEQWWQCVGDLAPAEGKELLRQAVHQGKAFFELADGVTRGTGVGAPGSPGTALEDDVLWRLPLEIWQRAAANALGTRSTQASGVQAPRQPLQAYRRALSDYAAMLRGVGDETLKDASRSWRTRRDALHGEAGLRELFDLCVDIGERHYGELVASEAFAEASGRLVNALVRLVGDWRRLAGGQETAPGDGALQSADPEGSAGEGGFGDRRTPVDPLGLMAGLGIAPERTLAELRAFGDKLSVALATLRDIGPIHVGTAARDTVLEEGKLKLYHYRPTTGTSNPVPVLIVYALANRPYMMDLEPERSMIRALLDAGLDVYLVDWGYPDGEDRETGLDDYVLERMGKCVQAVCQRHDVAGITLLGVCQGGTFSLCFAALEPDKVRNLVLMVTPVDFHTPGNLLTAWLRHVDVDAMVDTLGNIPGELLNWAFVSMKPLRLTGQKYLDMLERLDDAGKARTFLRMEKWIHDSPAQAGEAFRQFAKALFQENRLVRGELHIGARRVDLRRITMPVLNVYATEDHIVPPAASLALEEHIGSADYTRLAFEGGHIGIYVSARAQRQVPPAIAAWLGKRCS